MLGLSTHFNYPVAYFLQTLIDFGKESPGNI